MYWGQTRNDSIALAPKEKDIIETVVPKTTERTKFKLAAPAAKVCLTLGGGAFADLALLENLVPSKIPSATMT
jgi:hypothetical protein